MESRRIGKRGFVFTFHDPYHFNTYVIDGFQHIFLCDTFCGPDSMREIIEYLDREKSWDKKKRRIILNSHYHYDHIWGNSVFANDVIIAHISCIELIRRYGQDALQKYKSHAKGHIDLVQPNLGFSTRVLFPEEGVLLFHSPGHTEDSISCFDMKDRVLFVGDNVESPIPFLYQPNLHLYKKSLNEYLAMEYEACIASHDPIMRDDSLIRKNLVYLESLSHWSISFEEMDSRTRALHLMNLASLAGICDSSQMHENAVAHYNEALHHLNAIQDVKQRQEIEEKLKSVARQ